MSEPTSRRDFLVVAAGAVAAAGCGASEPSSANADPEGEPLNFAPGTRAPTPPAGGATPVCAGDTTSFFIGPAAQDLGLNDALKLGVVTMPAGKINLYVCRDSQGIVGVDVTCTHLGCFPDFFPEQALFHCHCHGSQYTLSGALINGPALRPLPRYAACKGSDGLIHIDLSKTLP